MQCLPAVNFAPLVYTGFNSSRTIMAPQVSVCVRAYINKLCWMIIAIQRQARDTDNVHVLQNMGRHKLRGEYR